MSADDGGVKSLLASDGEIQAAMGRIGEEVGHLDFLVHALAYAPREAGRHVCRHEARGFLCRLEGPAGQYRHVDVPGSERVVQNYNVMGVAKAALEASVRSPAESPAK